MYGKAPWDVPPELAAKQRRKVRICKRLRRTMEMRTVAMPYWDVVALVARSDEWQISHPAGVLPVILPHMRHSLSHQADTLIADAARALALIDLITTKGGPETVPLAVQRGRESYADLMRRRNLLHLPEGDGAVFQGIIDRMRAQLKFLSARL